METTDKGFKVLTIRGVDTLKLGGVGICDMCNNAFFKGKYIGVLNYATCEPCFEEWHEEATYFEEDSKYEQVNIDNVSKTIYGKFE